MILLHAQVGQRSRRKQHYDCKKHENRVCLRLLAPLVQLSISFIATHVETVISTIGISETATVQYVDTRQCPSPRPFWVQPNSVLLTSVVTILSAKSQRDDLKLYQRALPIPLGWNLRCRQPRLLR